MDEAKIRDNQIVERYVLGQLSEEESTEFEEYFLSRPDIIEQIEAEQLLQAGFRHADNSAESVTSEKVAGNTDASSAQKIIDWFKTPLPAYAFLLPLALVIPIAFQQSPQTAPEIELVHFSSEAQRSGSTVLEVNVADPSKPNGLLIKVQEATYEYYELRLIGNNDKPYSWSSNHFSVGALREKLVVVPPNAISKGRYRIELWGIGKDEMVEVKGFCHVIEKC